MADHQKFHSLVTAAEAHAKGREFERAHLLYGEALKGIPSESEAYSTVYKEYLATGFIYYSRQNDMSGLRILLSAVPDGGTDTGAGLVVADICQEIASRATDLESLKAATEKLESMHKNSSSRSRAPLANSLGLAYRRLGERTDLDTLKKAASVLREGIGCAKGAGALAVQLRDNLGVTLVRMFESTGDPAYLDEAEGVFLEGIDLLASADDRVAGPRILNDLGNVYKQKVLALGEASAGTRAIECYEKAAEAWTEEDSPYEWGLAQKNMGETMFAMGKLANDARMIEKAAEHCLAALKYRDLENSPYQWAKSAEILFAIAVFLQGEGETDDVMRRRVRALARMAMDNAALWDAGSFPGFYDNARAVLG